MRLNHWPMTAALLILALIFLGACAGSSAPMRFYLLNPLPDSEKGRQRRILPSTVTVGIGPVKFPAYLDRRQIVTRVTENELHVAEFEEWGGALKENFTRVLVENLHILLPEDAFEVFPFTGSSQIDYHVELEVLRMDGRLGGKASLDAHWSLYKRRGGQLLFTARAHFDEPVGGPGYAALVTALSRTVETLSRNIAATVEGLSLKSNAS